MQFYQEITLLPDVEISPYFLWTKVYTQIHLAFVMQKDVEQKVKYGVSFPQYRMVGDKQVGFLGFKVRVFAESEAELQALNLATWLVRLTDYVHLNNIRTVPQDRITGYVCYYRVMPKKSLEQRIEHQAKRHGVSLEEARAHLQNCPEEKTVAPFIQLNSLNSGHAFRLDIGKQAMPQAQQGVFGLYGLSRVATVPEFA